MKDERLLIEDFRLLIEQSTFGTDKSSI